jgi:hypothetical protein
MVERAVRLGLGGLVLLASSCLLSCATSFVGDAQFPGGALGCFKQCQRIGMEMASFVYVGEYSSACACKLKSTATATQSSVRDSDIEGAVVAAGAGVEMQRRRSEAARQGSLTMQH